MVEMTKENLHSYLVYIQLFLFSRLSLYIADLRGVPRYIGYNLFLKIYYIILRNWPLDRLSNSINRLK